MGREHHGTDPHGRRPRTRRLLRHRGQESEPGCHRASRTVVVPDRRRAARQERRLLRRHDPFRLVGVALQPGLDFAHETDGDGIGQALALARFAAHHRVEAIVVSIGGNDFGFGALAGGCVTGYLASVGGPPQLCSRDAGPAGQVRSGAAGTGSV